MNMNNEHEHANGIEMNECMKEGMNEWINEWMDEWKNG